MKFLKSLLLVGALVAQGSLFGMEAQERAKVLEVLEQAERSIATTYNARCHRLAHLLQARRPSTYPCSQLLACLAQCIEEIILEDDAADAADENSLFVQLINDLTSAADAELPKEGYNGMRFFFVLGESGVDSLRSFLRNLIGLGSVAQPDRSTLSASTQFVHRTLISYDLI